MAMNRMKCREVYGDNQTIMRGRRRRRRGEYSLATRSLLIQRRVWVRRAIMNQKQYSWLGTLIKGMRRCGAVLILSWTCFGNADELKSTKPVEKGVIPGDNLMRRQFRPDFITPRQDLFSKHKRFEGGSSGKQWKECTWQSSRVKEWLCYSVATCHLQSRQSSYH